MKYILIGVGVIVLILIIIVVGSAIQQAKEDEERDNRYKGG